MISRRGALPRRGILSLPRAVFTATALAVRNARRVQCAADNVVAHAGQVFDAPAPDQDDRVLLEAVAFAWNIGGYFHSVCQPDAGDFPQCRVRLFRGHRPYLHTHAALLGRALAPLRPVMESVVPPTERRRLRLLYWLGPSAADELVNR